MIRLDINSVDYSDHIVWDSLVVEQNLTSQVDNANFKIRKYGLKVYKPAIGDEIEIFDNTEKVFGGVVTFFNEITESNAEGILYGVTCVDYTYQFDRELVAETYENMTVAEIIAEIVDNYCPGFTYNNSTSDFLIEKIVFNQIAPSRCLTRIANLLKFEWYIDYDKDVHFFSKFTNTAPYNLTDTSGNYIVKTLQRKIDGTQIANQVKVRGGLGTETSLFTDVITVKGGESLSFKLPYKFKDLVIRVDDGGGYDNKQVGIEFIDQFVGEGGSAEVLYNYQDDSIRFESNLNDGDLIEFSGYRKYPIIAIASNDESINLYGLKEKLIEDRSIEDQSTARKRAEAEVRAYKDELNDVVFETYTTGLRTGMVINVESEKRDFVNDFLITKLIAKPIDPNNFGYSVTLMTTRKFGLIEALQKLLEPEDTGIDNKEVPLIIKTDYATMTISEVIEVIAAVNDMAEIVIVEDIQKDPLGAGVEPEWVLSPYFPTSHADPKRPGRLDLSFEVY